MARFSSNGFFKGLIIALVLLSAGMYIVRRSGWLGGAADSPAVLAGQALDALEAVKRRQPTDRRPASYDAILAPLDTMLRQAREIFRSEQFNPANDVEAIRAYALPVIDIATQADRQARTETGPLAKEYRFNDQKGEACFYLASALWERVNASQGRRRTPLEEPAPLPTSEMNEIRRYLDLGIEAAPDNRDLWYLRGTVNRAEGLFAPAAKDLERALEIDSRYAAAWNVLGLVRINLREFDGAEFALEWARELAVEEAARQNAPTGAEYTSIIYNLATFHEGLANYYQREDRITPSVESRGLMQRHATEARRYFDEFLTREPDSPDARAVRERLGTLPN